jgi:hypothetical protein
VKTDFIKGENAERSFKCFAVLMVFILSVSNLFSQNVQQKPTRQSSLDAFSKGDYELAYNGFRELLVKYPKDPLYKYYSGVCLVKLDRDPEQAILFLTQAQQGAAMLRTIPSDALFWLGRAQQMSGRFREALTSYNTFTEQNGRKAARELGIQEFIQQCNEKKGQITEKSITPTPSEVKDNSGISPVREIAEPVYDKKSIGREVKSVNDTIPAKYDAILSEALDYQFKADSLNKIAGGKKNSLEKLTYKEKTIMRSVIAETENLAASYQEKADQKYAEAQAAMNLVPFTTEGITEASSSSVSDTSAVRIQVINTQVSKTKTDNKKDTIRIDQVTEPHNLTAENVDRKVFKDSLVVSGPDKGTVPVAVKPLPAFSVFEVVTKPVYAVNEKIIIDPEIPGGLIYRIQVAVFRNPVSPSYFKGITPVYGFKIAGTDKTNYYAGMFRRIADAKKALAIVRQKGFKDAFIVALSGNRAVSSERAALLEKEWGKKPFTTGIRQELETPADTIPPTLSFRVEVARSIKPVEDDVLEGMKKLAGSRGLDTESLKDGTLIYLIGEFITFESAEEYASLLTRNGYRNTKVVAWLGRKEIPVETAKQLFKKLE